jgi:hypothetical protein
MWPERARGLARSAGSLRWQARAARTLALQRLEHFELVVRRGVRKHGGLGHNLVEVGSLHVDIALTEPVAVDGLKVRVATDAQDADAACHRHRGLGPCSEQRSDLSVTGTTAGDVPSLENMSTRTDARRAAATASCPAARARSHQPASALRLMAVRPTLTPGFSGSFSSITPTKTA